MVSSHGEAATPVAERWHQVDCGMLNTAGRRIGSPGAIDRIARAARFSCLARQTDDRRTAGDKRVTRSAWMTSPANTASRPGGVAGEV